MAYVCICRAIKQSDIRAHLETLQDTTTTAQTSTSCGDGKPFQCGQCACEISEMVKDHNNRITVSRLAGQTQRRREDA